MEHRSRKRARTTEPGEPAIGAGHGSTSPEVVGISPQREETGQILPASTTNGAPIAGADKETEAKHLEGGHQEADPLDTPSTTVLPESSSPGRTNPSHEDVHEESVRIKDTPVTDVAGNRAMAINIAEGGTTPLQQTYSGKHFLHEHFSVLVSVAFLHLDFLI